MMVIGLTGGLGTGKSTVSGIFAEWGARVFDADRIAHELMRPGTRVHRQVRSRFGKEIVDPQGRIDRGRLGRVVFHSKKRLKELTGIMHPEVRSAIDRGLRSLLRRSPAAVAVLDIPLLVESRHAYPLDALVVVSAPKRVVLERLAASRVWDQKEYERRSRFQWPPARKMERADFVVDNGGSRAATRRQARRIWVELKKKGEVT